MSNDYIWEAFILGLFIMMGLGSVDINVTVFVDGKQVIVDDTRGTGNERG